MWLTGRKAGTMVRPGGLGVLKLAWGAFAFAALVVVASGFLAWQQFQGAAAGVQEERLRAVASQIAAGIAGTAAGYRQVLERAAAAPESALEALPGIYPDLLHLRLVPAGAHQVEPDADPPFGYAAVDLIRRAEQARRAPPLEMHRISTPDGHLAYAVPVVQDGEAVATLFVQQSADFVRRQVTQAAAEHGHLELWQGQSRIAAAGRAPEAAPAVQVAVPGTAWMLSLRSAQVAALPATGPPLSFTWMFAAAVAALGLIFAAFGIGLRRLLDRDLAQLVQHCIDLVNRKRAHTFSVRLSEFKVAVEALDRHLVQVPTPPAPIIVPASDEECDTPEVLFMDEVLTVEETPDSDAPAGASDRGRR